MRFPQSQAVDHYRDLHTIGSNTGGQVPLHPASMAELLTMVETAFADAKGKVCPEALLPSREGDNMIRPRFRVALDELYSGWIMRNVIARFDGISWTAEPGESDGISWTGEAGDWKAVSALELVPPADWVRRLFQPLPKHP